ncbi:hypothetical protein WJX74_001604 [Apatococcus lobatus]|uniref:Glutathione transferase n=1 Tax=Apatococcus lobatus TaxID=904363 RepID=A0AAW1S6S2_9CHLO
MALPLTCLYGGLNVALYALTAALFAFDVRFRYWILHGDGGDNSKLSAEQKALAQRRKGAQANYAEYQPYGIFLLFLLEVNSLLSTNLLHGFGIAWTVLRVLHFFQLYGWIGPIQFRKYGWIGTELLLLGGSAIVVYFGITNVTSGSSSVQEAAYSRIMDYADAAKKEL